MNWTVRLSESAQKDFDRLDHSQQEQVTKALLKIARNPLPVSQGGYGKPLGNRGNLKLMGYYKVKLRNAGIRIVYELRYTGNQVYVIVIGMRSDEAVYFTAAKRIRKEKRNDT